MFMGQWMAMYQLVFVFKFPDYFCFIEPEANIWHFVVNKTLLFIFVLGIVYDGIKNMYYLLVIKQLVIYLKAVCYSKFNALFV